MSAGVLPNEEEFHPLVLVILIVMYFEIRTSYGTCRVRLHLPGDESQGSPMGYASGVGLKRTTSRSEGMNDQSSGIYIDYCNWSLDANRIYDTRMATQLSAQRGFWRNPENKGNLASKHTHGRQNGGMVR